MRENLMIEVERAGATDVESKVSENGGMNLRNPLQIDLGKWRTLEPS